MRRFTEQDKYEYRRTRNQRSLNPCPGRTTTEREYITRRIIEIDEILNYHLNKLAETESTPQWLPETVITPTMEQDAVETRETFQTAKRNAHGYVLDMYDRNQRASNRVRIGTWYRNIDNQLYFATLIAVSPLQCAHWGALPLTMNQWKIIIHSLILSHMEWTWLHAVRRHWHDDTYHCGGTFGWYMEPCKKLDKGVGELCTGRAIYSHIQRKYSAHVSGT